MQANLHQDRRSVSRFYDQKERPWRLCRLLVSAQCALPLSRFCSHLAVPILVSTHFAIGWEGATPQSESRQQAAAPPRNAASQSTASLELPITFERRVGDLDATVKSHGIRVLVVPSRSGIFYDKGHPQGIYYEAFDEFQHFVNQKYKTGSLKIGYGVIVTTEREKGVLFTTPIDANVKQVIVTRPKAPPITNLEDLSGKEVYVSSLSVEGMMNAGDKVYYERCIGLRDYCQLRARNVLGDACGCCFGVRELFPTHSPTHKNLRLI